MQYRPSMKITLDSLVHYQHLRGRTRIRLIFFVWAIQSRLGIYNKIKHLRTSTSAAVSGLPTPYILKVAAVFIYAATVKTATVNFETIGHRVREAPTAVQRIRHSQNVQSTGRKVSPQHVRKAEQHKQGGWQSQRQGPT